MRSALLALGRGPVKPVRRHVGGVGLQHQRRQRQLAGQPPHLQGPLVSDGAAEPQLETELDELAEKFAGNFSVGRTNARLSQINTTVMPFGPTFFFARSAYSMERPQWSDAGTGAARVLDLGPITTPGVFRKT